MIRRMCSTESMEGLKHSRKESKKIYDESIYLKLVFF